MKIETIILWISLFVISLSSCDEKEYFKINKDTWITFDTNDTIVFLNNISNDTFYISEIYNYFEEIDKQYNYEHLDIDYIKINITDNKRGSSYSLLRSYNGVTVYWGNSDKHISYKYDNPIQYDINSKNFNHVYMIENNVLNNDYDIKKAYYTDIYGIIAYELNNGELYEMDCSNL
ncbi:hypothetical protein ACFLSE_09285 [Bacteroidota bacterium]